MKAQDDPVDYYVNLITNRSISALSYEFPEDARMHKPTNNAVEGKKISWLFQMSIL